MNKNCRIVKMHTEVGQLTLICVISSSQDSHFQLRKNLTNIFLASRKQKVRKKKEKKESKKKERKERKSNNKKVKRNQTRSFINYTI